jgi:hypothetical protein
LCLKHTEVYSRNAGCGIFFCFLPATLVVSGRDFGETWIRGWDAWRDLHVLEEEARVWVGVWRGDVRSIKDCFRVGCVTCKTEVS